MQPLADALGCHVVAYDRPTFGFTERPTQWEEHKNPYTQQASVEFCVEFMRTIGYGGRKIIFIGTSGGATMSCSIAIKYPHLVHCIIMLGPALKAEDQGTLRRYFSLLFEIALKKKNFFLHCFTRDTKRATTGSALYFRFIARSVIP